MLTTIKLALRISTTAFDAEIQLLIDDCLSEMRSVGVLADPTDPQVQTAVIAYCKWKFGENAQKEQWEKIYHEKLGQLKLSRRSD